MTQSVVPTSSQAPAAKILCSDTLEQSTRYLIERAKAYDTVILLYEDDANNHVMGIWAEKDRLQFATRKIGYALSGIEVHTFGMDVFPPNTVIQISLRTARQDASSQNPNRAMYRSILNELSLISVTIYPDGHGKMLLQ